MIRRGQDEGVLHADRNADAEAWTFLAGGVLGMVGRRIGLLHEDEVHAIRKARLDWLTRVQKRSLDGRELVARRPDRALAGAHPPRRHAARPREAAGAASHKARAFS